MPENLVKLKLLSFGEFFFIFIDLPRPEAFIRNTAKFISGEQNNNISYGKLILQSLTELFRFFSEGRNALSVLFHGILGRLKISLPISLW